MIRIVCICGRAFKTEDRYAGRRAKCPGCGADLMIGPASETRQNGTGGAADQAWWDASGPAEQAARATSPTRSASDPGAEAVNPSGVPAGSGHQAQPHASGPSLSAVASPTAAGPPPRGLIGAHVPVPGPSSFAVRNRWVIAGGAAALVVVAVGTFLWLRPGTPGVGEATPAPPIAGADKRDESRPKTARVATGAAASVTSPAEPKADGDGPGRAALAGESARLRLLVPAYIYPGGEGRNDWERLFKAASKVEIVAIANPSSGPGEQRNLDYHAIFTEAGNRGITIVGYVSTDFAKRSQAAIEKDVDTWLVFYPQIRGFFFDQQPREVRHAAQFAGFRDYVKRKLRDPLVITNPGVPCDEAYLAQGVSNVTCVFNNYQGFDSFELPAALKSYDPVRFAAMPYDIPDVETMRSFVRDAILKRIGYIYVSDAKQPNPWAKLPSYWEEEVDAVSRLR
jgi:hypothetical protein